MPILRPSGSDFTTFVKAAAQYVPAGRAGKPSKSGGVPVSLPGLGAVVRTSQVGALASPTTSAVVINGVTPPPASGGGGAPPAGFLPTGSALWLDGADPAGTGIAPSNGATVSTWVDKSGNGRNAVAGVAGTYSTAQRSIAFNGTNYYNSSYTAAPTNETLFLIFNLTTSSNNPFMIASSTCGGRVASTYTTDGRFAAGQLCVSWGGVTTDIITTGVNTLGVVVTNGTNNSVSLHGALTLVGPVAGITYTAGTTTEIGGALGAQYLTTGYINEVIAYSSVLGTSQRQQIEGYLAWKWGIQASLPAGHPYKTAAPTA